LGIPAFGGEWPSLATRAATVTVTVAVIVIVIDIDIGMET
jgi:hypothetical protein